MSAASAGPVTPSLRAALDAARGVFNAYDRSAGPELWRAAQQVLQHTIQRPELSGQALVGEARRLGVLSLPDAHALVALGAFADRSSGPASTEGERIMIREAWMALQHAVPPEAFEAPVSPYAPPPAPPGTPGARPAPAADPSSWSAPPRSSFAPPGPGPATPASPAASAAAGAAAPAAASTPHASAEAAASRYATEEASTAASRRRWRAPRFTSPFALLGALTVVVAIGTAIWWFTVGRIDRAFDTGVAAYQRGARDVARSAFVEVAQRRPDDARPLIYLGRMSREDGDVQRAKRMLTAAVRIAPGSAVALRELAGTMLADAQPELARGFYVRALTIEPTDRVAQGFLACALYRLQRYDEARRWSERAGPGDWQRCIGPIPMAPMMPGMPPGMPPGAMMPPPGPPPSSPR